MIRLVSSMGLSARRIVPLRAIPVTPVAMIEGISSKVMPPMATMGRCIPASFICETIERYPSSPNTGERFLFGGSESERTATNVIGSGFVVHLYIFKCIGCATYDEIFSQHFPCFCYGHILFDPDARRRRVSS